MNFPSIMLTSLDSLAKKLCIMLLCSDAVFAQSPNLAYKVVGSHPHNESYFTQGFYIEDGVLYESTGGYGSSLLLQYSLEPFALTKKASLPRQFFGEGISILGDTLYQLTWKKKKCLQFDKTTFEYKGSFSYKGEGWGLTHHSGQLISSNGSAELTFRDPENGAVLKTLTVTEQGKPLKLLNELEFIDGAIFANVWYSNRIVKIDPDSGKVLGQLDLRKLKSPYQNNPDAVLNGIAYDKEKKELWVTGKLWSKIYRLKLISQ